MLLTSPDTLLATLTPALVAEANMLRERFAHRHHTGALIGMSSRSRRGESSRHGDTIGSSLDRNVEAAARRSALGKLIETDGVPLVDMNDLKAMIRLLRIVQVTAFFFLSILMFNEKEKTRLSIDICDA